MSGAELEKLVAEGVRALEGGDTATALVLFERVAKIARTPTVCSYLAFCLAKERGESKRGVSLCIEAIKDDPRNPVHFLNLGRIYLLADNKKDAIRIFRKGLKFEWNRQIEDELNRLGVRKKPPIPFLKRDNPINKYLGRILKKMGLR